MDVMDSRRRLLMQGLQDSNIAPDLSLWVDGYIATDGSVNSNHSNGEKSSPFISVEEGLIYTFSYTMSGNPPGQYWAALCFYDANKARKGNRIAPGTKNDYYDVSGTAPTDAKYVRLSFRTYNIATSVKLIKN